jgi:hypothetical protein
MSQFELLINGAKNEEQPQKMLFLFAKATNMFEEGKSSYQSGTIEAVLCVDKFLEELTTFKDLVLEADEYIKNWDLIFVSTVSGENNVVPRPEVVDAALHKMSNAFANGDDLSQYVIWNRKEQAIIVS